MKIEEFIEDNKKNIKHTLEPKDLAMLVQESIVNKKTVCTHSQKKKKPRPDKPKSGRSRSHLTVVK